ncbi:HD family phosphohydrolase [Geobacter sp. AOG2]|uniref:HD family phosphohydrolase n=1 Tax=Geobacter sp. AOG2 TaxID=1566347 RepID=UPI001CC37ADE|nr:HDIG domain-containing metalloprotein [Geobacter sp. AOG2]GFE62793.1 HD family phosphohydrolase [Geobacter sp. AOG2]
MPDQPVDNQGQNTLTHLTKLGSNLLDLIVRRFSDPRTARRNRFILLFTTTLLLTIILLPGQRFRSAEFKPGDIATSDIRAAQDFLVEDRPLTEQRRKEAGNNAPVVYNLSDRVPSIIIGKLEQVVGAVRKERTAKSQKNTEEWRALFLPLLDTELSEAEIRAFTRIAADRVFLADAGRMVNELYRRRIVLDGKAFQTDTRRGVEFIDDNGRLVEDSDATIDFTEIREARKLVASWQFSGLNDRADGNAIARVIARILLPNLFYNREASEARAKAAMEAVRPVLFKVQRGEMIVRVGERISPEQAHKLQTIFQENNSGNRYYSAVGIFALILVLFYFPYRFALKNIRKFNPTNKDILIISLLVTGSFLLFKIALLIAHNIGPVFPDIDINSFFYLFPFAAGPMIVRIFINSEVALVYCAILAPLLGIMFDSNMSVVIYALLGSIVGAHGVRQCSDRSTIYTAGLKVSVVNLAMALAFQTSSATVFSMQTVYVVFFALVSGVLSAGLVSGFIPLIETLFHYTTDIKLLELANLNSPMLRDLMVRAPGTYHHSVVVGNLVESAAEAINANPLLARVSAYYHDIGKISKPLYFIENLGGEENRHDKLTPSMSALILISHIKEGSEMARERHLGQPIMDIIRQHHGTGLIKFFYDRAKTQAEANGQTVEEQDFRYPGPKPQTREAGIVMLADCVEAASRTLVNPTPDRIQGMVQKIINNIFMDGQLEECELTLKNLHEIAKSFNRILNGIFHHRIDYPEPVYKGGGGSKKVEHKTISGEHAKPGNGDATSADTTEQPPAAAPDHGAPAKKGGGEDLKRLGMS